MSTQDLTGKLVFITGANTGIGRVTAHELAKRGARLVFAGRSEDKTRPVMDDIAKDTGNQALEFLACDLSSLASVRAAADTFVASDRPIDVLINNAGLGGTRGQTVEGFELTFGTNHLGHFLLTERLRPRLLQAPAARIINVASMAHYQAKHGIDFDAVRKPTGLGVSEYAVSKLANVLHASELARRLQGTTVLACSLHPGVVATNIWQRSMGRPLAALVKLFMMSSDDGARTTVFCATTPTLADHNGAYFDKPRPTRPSQKARDETLAKALWDFSTEAVAPFLS